MRGTLGTASRGAGAAVRQRLRVLEAPFNSALDSAAVEFHWLPVRFLSATRSSHAIGSI